jgi:hypothetical protein
MGYLLVPDTSQQKILMLIGPPRSGRGTIGRVIRSLVGLDNVTAPTLSGMATNFGLAPLIGKTVAVIHDARLSGRADAQVIVERLLSISGEDAQHAWAREAISSSPGPAWNSSPNSKTWPAPSAPSFPKCARWDRTSGLTPNCYSTRGSRGVPRMAEITPETPPDSAETSGRSYPESRPLSPVAMASGSANSSG